MRELERNGKTYRLPSALNAFQEDLYIHLIDWKHRHVTEEPGTARGHSYDAILPDYIAAERPALYPGIRDALEEHRARYPFRIHKYFNHMASSQAANINLFLPILRHPRCAAVLRAVKPDFARLAAEHLDHGYRIEFWDEPHGSLRDKTDVSGTDADIGIAYEDDQGALCLWLIEHKLSEGEFTTCGGYRSAGRRARHDCGRSFAELVNEPSACYYHDAKHFAYWEVTARNSAFFANADGHVGCPFRGGMNQLWRNQLLALAIEQDRKQPYQRVTFSVVRHPGNTSLDRTLEAYRRLIGDNPAFTIFTSEMLVDAAEAHADDALRAWVDWYRELYRV